MMATFLWVFYYDLGMPLLAASLGVGLAIGTMRLARCLHTPGGACALGEAHQGFQNLRDVGA